VAVQESIMRALIAVGLALLAATAWASPSFASEPDLSKCSGLSGSDLASCVAPIVEQYVEQAEVSGEDLKEVAIDVGEACAETFQSEYTACVEAAIAGLESLDTQNADAVAAGLTFLLKVCGNASDMTAFAQCAGGYAQQLAAIMGVSGSTSGSVSLPSGSGSRTTPGGGNKPPITGRR
jgi:hypothetical protein